MSVCVCAGSSLLRGLISSCGERRLLSMWYAGFSLRCLLGLLSTDSQAAGSAAAAPGLCSPGSVAAAPGLWSPGSAAVAHELWSLGSAAAAPWLCSPGSRALEPGLSSCGARVQLLCGMWGLPGPGTKPTRPALAEGFLPTEPPGKLPPLFKAKRLVFLKR